jgi:thymidylate kinase
VIVAVEGLDGSGKSTLVGYLIKALSRRGLVAQRRDMFRHEPVRDVARVFNNAGLMTAELLAGLHAVDLLREWETKPSADVLVWDRYAYSSFATTRARGCDPAVATGLLALAPTPDIVVYLRIDVTRSAEHVYARGGPAFFEAGLDLLYPGDQLPIGLAAFERGQIPEVTIRSTFVRHLKRQSELLDEALVSAPVIALEIADAAAFSPTAEELAYRISTKVAVGR